MTVHLTQYWLKWIDTYYADCPSVLTFGIFLTAVLLIIRELDDTAIIDLFPDGYSGAFFCLFRVTFATVGIFTFMGQWNSYIWPLIVTNSEEMHLISVSSFHVQSQFMPSGP